MNAAQFDEDARARFWRKAGVGGPNDCWHWTAGKNSNGYGMVCSGGTMVGAHRVAYTLSVGSIPDGLCVCHKCDVPTCVNPLHLFLGTHGDNANDKSAKGRCPRGVGHHRSSVSEEDVRNIRRRYANGGVTHSELGREFGLARAAIGFITRRETWSHIS